MVHMSFQRFEIIEHIFYLNGIKVKMSKNITRKHHMLRKQTVHLITHKQRNHKRD